MAGIDKTYARTWSEYMALREWIAAMDDKSLSGCMYDADLTEDVFDRGDDVPVINTSTGMDEKYMIYCPLQFVQNRMQEVYGGNPPPKNKKREAELQKRYDKYKRSVYDRLGD